MPRCKAPEILRSEAYLDVRRNNADACLPVGRGVFQQPDRLYVVGVKILILSRSSKMDWAV
jgi:hypothetical protein